VKKIDIKQGPTHLTCMVVGDSRAGKTRFAGTWPRPIFLADASEHGWTTLGSLGPDDLYEADREPKVVGIETPQDMVLALKALQTQASGAKVAIDEWPLAQGKWECGTVVIDSLTFYADAYFSALEAENAGGKNDKRAWYGELASHLRYLMIQFHRLPYHIVWTSLSSTNDDSQLRGALIAGSTAAKAPARCDLWLYLDKYSEKVKGEDNRRETQIVYEAHTQNYAGNKAGHRFGTRLPPIIEPHFDVIEDCLGMTPWTDRLQPKSSGRKSATKKTATNNRAAAQS
jgi:hypothetical protein